MHTKDYIQQVVKDYIQEHIDLADLDADINIFKTRLATSLFAIELMTFLEKSFDLKIGMDDLDMTYFESVNAITVFVTRKELEKVR